MTAEAIRVILDSVWRGLRLCSFLDAQGVSDVRYLWGPKGIMGGFDSNFSALSGA